MNPRTSKWTNPHRQWFEGLMARHADDVGYRGGPRCYVRLGKRTESRGAKHRIGRQGDAVLYGVGSPSWTLRQTNSGLSSACRDYKEM